MKLLTVTLSVLFFLSCCKKKEYFCDVKDPVNDLEWLKKEIDKRQAYSDSILVKKMEMPSLSEKGFLFQFNVPKPSSLPPQKYYYSCNGTLICSDLGGLAGSTCGNITNDVIITDIVYKSY